MAQQALPGAEVFETPLVSPWPTLGAGAGLVGLAWLWSLASPEGAGGRALLVFLGLLILGVGLYNGLRPIRSAAVLRLIQAGMLFLAGLTALLGSWALSAWDSIALLLYAASLLAFLGAILLLLPWKVRAVVISLLAVVHLGGIFNAIVSVAPMGASEPWLSQVAFMSLYRPWLQFTHLTNGYHFYAPEPGPVSLVYFRVEFADGTGVWERIPNHKKCRTGLETRRMGALSSSLGQTIPVPPMKLDALAEQRAKAGKEHKPEIPMLDPMNPLPLMMLYREPGIQAQMQIASYVRFLAKNTPDPKDPAQAVTGVKVYRVDFTNPRADLFANFKNPEDVFEPTLYLWFFLGDYQPDGELKPNMIKKSYFPNGAENQEARVQDPFLYWMIPVVRRREAGQTRERVIHFPRIHAGDTETEKNP